MNNKLERILIIDDIRTDLHLIGKLITNFGYESVLSDSAVSAYEILDDSFDLIVVDALMPEMTGFELVTRVRENKKLSHIPVIMVTSLSGRADRIRAVESGINDYITKPVDKVELKVRVSSMLKMKAAQDEVRTYQAQLVKLVKQKTSDLSKTLFKLQAVLDGINDAMIAIDKNGLITESNFAFQKLTGKSDKTLKDSLVYDFIGENQVNDFNKLISTDIETEMDMEFKNWGNKTFSIIVTPMEKANIFMMRDITEKTRVDSQRNRFLSILSHELRTPLNGIMGISELILDDENLDDGIREDVNIILDSGKDLDTIVNEILKFVQINERDETREDKININDTILNVFQMFEDERDKKNINLSLTLDSDCKNAIISAIPDQITEIVKQIIENSIKFGKDDGYTKVKLSKENDYFIINISDNGLGIPTEKIPRIYDSFYQAEDYTTRKNSGLGLGLTITKRLLEIYNGSIHITSKVDVGTEVIVMIPSN